MGESDLSAEVSSTTVLPDASDLSGSESGSEIELTWTNNDDSPDGGIDVERSNDGFSTVSTVESGLPPSTMSYTDTTVSDGEAYEYRIERSTDHATVKGAAIRVVTSIGEARIKSGETTYKAPIYDPNTISNNWLRIKVSDTIGVLKPIDATGELLRAFNPSGAVVGIETRQL